MQPQHTTSAYETRIDGGRLDGWTLTTYRRSAALRCHDGAVRLARETAQRKQ